MTIRFDPRPALLAACSLAACGDPAAPIGADGSGTDGDTPSSGVADESTAGPATVTDTDGAISGSSDDGSGGCAVECTCEASCTAGMVTVRGSAGPNACAEDQSCPASMSFACPGECGDAADPAQTCAIADAIVASGDPAELCAPALCPDPFGDGDALYDQAYGPEDRQVFDAYLPDDPSDAPLPVFVWIHGGAWLGGSKADIPGPIVDLRRQGVIVMSIEYRFSDTPFPTTVSDVRAAIRWIHEHGADLGMDGNRIGVGGDSAGGHLTNMLGVASDVAELDVEPSAIAPTVRLAVPFYGPSELLAMDADAADNGCGPDGQFHDAHGSPEAELVDCDGDLPDCPDIAQLASPLTHIDASDPPFVVLHGGSDCTVPTPQGRRMHDTLVAAGVESTYFETPGAGHSFDEVINDENLGALREAVDRHLLHCVGP